jgi:pyridoxamine 5'-phosphate oxidase
VPELREQDAADDPLRQFRAWLEDERLDNVALATATAEGAPSVRMVLLKDITERGLTFFTGYESRKGGELAANPRAALLLYWPALGRQVRVEGAVERIEPAESDAYWATRPGGSRVSAAASPQSRVVADRAELERRVADVRARYGDEPPRPATWGGFRLEPVVWEFWQHRDDRLHDRLRYRRDGESWVRERLAP